MSRRCVVGAGVEGGRGGRAVAIAFSCSCRLSQWPLCACWLRGQRVCCSVKLCQLMVKRGVVEQQGMGGGISGCVLACASLFVVCVFLVRLQESRRSNMKEVAANLNDSLCLVEAVAVSPKFAVILCERRRALLRTLYVVAAVKVRAPWRRCKRCVPFMPPRAVPGLGSVSLCSCCS